MKLNYQLIEGTSYLPSLSVSKKTAELVFSEVDAADTPSAYAEDVA